LRGIDAVLATGNTPEHGAVRAVTPATAMLLLLLLWLL
jgi:hypothetical protein